MVLPFQEQLILELIEDPNGGLVVLSSGLPLETLVASLLLLHTRAQGTLLILAATDAQRARILRSLRSLLQGDAESGIPGDLCLPGEIPGELASHHRKDLYSSGAALFVTPRILVADLLTSKCRPSSLAGLVILNAHRLSDTSTEAFIARMVRSGNKTAYVRAFSDHPQSMTAGFAKAERIMKCLFVRRLHLWPRFQLQVSTDLEREPPEVIDIRVPMSPAMKGIQTAVLGAMDACLKELRKTNKVDVDDLTVESGLFKSFDEIVRRQLDPIWHTLGKKTRQLVYDLGTLRKLADYLVRYDAVTYLKYLDTIRVSQGARSIWVFADSSHKIFELAKRRVYRMVFPDGSKLKEITSAGSNKKRAKDGGGTSLSNRKETSANPGVVLEEVLEEPPKWKLLRELLKEIQEERKKTSSNSNVGQEDTDVVLVACKDERSCMQLEDCILKGPRQVMQDEWEKYLLGKVELFGLQKRKKQKSQNPKGFGILNGEILTSGENATAASSRLENEALLAVASGFSNFGKKNSSAGFDDGPSKVGLGKGKAGQKRKGVPVSGNEMKVKVCANEEVAQSSSSLQNPTNTGNLDDGVVTESAQEMESAPFLRKHRQDHSDFDIHLVNVLPPIQFYSFERDQKILDVLKPSVIVVYHPNVTFVREIEIYKAENPLKSVKVYFLFYEDSVEVQKFEANIHRENAAFDTLIRQKSLMMIPVDQDGLCTGFAGTSEAHSLTQQNLITRKAGGRKLQDKEMQVIVDMREFMSSLPNVLHQKGMRIIPVVLEVGDYILSPLICVERKSISDLFQSFASGRLFHQVETMARYYQIPVLLIEFSQDKSFSFQSAGEIGDDVSPTSIISKLSLLVLHFPRLRLVWSRSVHATAEIFASLKLNQDEPDESRAVRVGVPSEDGVIENDVRAENYNTTAVEFLRRLPGVTDSNYRALMDGCNCLADLALLPVEKLAELMGGQKAARTLKEFLDAKFPTL